jgi:hypothetical protein
MAANLAQALICRSPSPAFDIDVFFVLFSVGQPPLFFYHGNNIQLLSDQVEAAAAAVAVAGENKCSSILHKIAHKCTFGPQYTIPPPPSFPRGTLIMLLGARVLISPTQSKNLQKRPFLSAMVAMQFCAVHTFIPVYHNYSISRPKTQMKRQILA